MLILASASPRRQELLRLITPDFTVMQAEVDESIDETIEPSVYVKKLAYHKAATVLKKNPDAIVIGADTMVSLDGQLLGKPVNRSEAVRMLQSLSGKQHQVYTGVSILSRTKQETFFVVTQVEFSALSNEEIKRYVELGEPMDKAGAYGIQGAGAVFIKSIHGDYYNVMGLPVSTLYQKLKGFPL